MFAAAVVGAFFGIGGTVAAYEKGVFKTKEKPRAKPTPLIAPDSPPHHYAGLAQTTIGRDVNKPVFEYPPPMPKDREAADLSPEERTQKDLNQNFADIAKYGLPSKENVYVKHGFVSSFCTSKRIPNWVMEMITPHTIQEKVASRSVSKFYSNEEIPAPFRADNQDYSAKQGLSRGHLAPAQFHKDSQTAMDATFDLSLNVVPQDMTVNGCDWFRLEQLCKKLTKEFDRMYIVSGPAFVPTLIPPQDPRFAVPKRVVSYELVGKHDIAVPTHLFKVILGERKDGAYGIASFLIPNEPILDEKKLTHYMLPRTELEQITGLQFFPKLFHQEDAKQPQSIVGTKAGDSRTVFDICSNTKTQCEGSYGSFSKAYRDAGRLRVSKDPQHLEKAYKILNEQAQAAGKPLDAIVEKEYNTKRKEFGNGSFLL